VILCLGWIRTRRIRDRSGGSAGVGAITTAADDRFHIDVIAIRMTNIMTRSSFHSSFSLVLLA